MEARRLMDASGAHDPDDGPDRADGNARAPMMIQDPTTAAATRGRETEVWTKIREDHYLDGPVTPRVAVIDLDPDTGANVPGAKVVPPTRRRSWTSYDVGKDDIDSPAFLQVSVWATVLRTMYMYEEADALGRRITWGFPAPQLLVVPRAGWWENAFYHRESHSLQFFSFQAAGRTVHTALSRDIVSHETGHAILDGIAPDLYDATDPQSLALHEAVADLTALSMAFRSHTLREQVLNETGGSIEDSSAFSSIGEQFGSALDPSLGFLRSLLNDRVLDPDPGRQIDEHGISEVLTGALYRFMCRLHQEKRAEIAASSGRSELQASGRALAISAERFKRMIIRGLDYLPPGEVTFADYGRAILAADQATHPTDEFREWLKQLFVERGIAADTASLDVVTNESHPSVAAADLQALADSDWVAYRFAEENRELLGIPGGTSYRILPRLVVTKNYYLSADPTPVKELLLKVEWTIAEDAAQDLPGPSQRRVKTGTTLVIDWDRRLVRARVRPLDLEGRRLARDAKVRDWVSQGLFRGTASASDSPYLGPAIEAREVDGVLRLRGTHAALHLVGGHDDA